ncbi:MAG: hypothetical protein ACP5LW_05545 [Nitrososphaeria archaeon]
MRIRRAVLELEGWLSSAVPLLFIALTIASFVTAPASGSSQLSGPYGSVQLQLTSLRIVRAEVLAPPRGILSGYQARGTIFVGGSWYYVNSSTYLVSTTATAYKSGSASTIFGASASNASASATASASASSTAVANSTARVVQTAQSYVSAPVKLYGYVTFYFLGGRNVTEPLAFNGSVFYVGNASSFRSATAPPEGTLLYTELYVIPVNPVTNQSIGAPLISLSEYNASSWLFIDLYNTVVALPQFNDTALWAYAARPSGSQPALPLAPYYNLVGTVAVIVLIPVSFLDLLVPGERGSLAGVLARISAGILVIMAFPFIYDRIAYALNVLNQMIIAYPLPYQDYAVSLAGLERDLVIPSTLTLTTALETGVLGLGYVIAGVILWLMSFMLGTVRILLLAGMITLFPLSIALRDFRYTQKLGRMIEETLLGLMLATILSASMLGVAYYLLSNWSSPENMFRLAGIQPQWVAMSAVLGAILAPAVLAPLLSAVYESASAIASVAGGVATAAWLGVASGGVLGYQAAGEAVRRAIALGEPVNVPWTYAKGVGAGMLTGLAQAALSSLPLAGAGAPMRVPGSYSRHEARLMKVLEGAIMRQRGDDGGF